MSSLALLGGRPLTTRRFASWPVFGDAEKEALLQVLNSGTWGGYNPVVQEFESRFAAEHGCRFGISTCNGTLSLEAALSACGIGPNDEVIVPPVTFVATASAVIRVGAVPVFADIDPRTGNLDPARVREALTSRTRAIIPVHFGGQVADMDAFLSLAADAKLAVIEDAAHAHGASWRGKKAGSFGDFGSFSFQQSKNLTAGEGGILITNDASLAQKARSIANQGRVPNGAWYQHETLGTNLRLTGFQAAVLNAQLDRLPELAEKRARNARLLTERLRGSKIASPLAIDERVTGHSFYIFVLRLNSESLGGTTLDQFVQALAAEGIPGVSSYPYPLYRNRLFNSFPHRVMPCPEAERMCRECFWVSHEVLLASEECLEDFVNAIDKVGASASDLAVPKH